MESRLDKSTESIMNVLFPPDRNVQEKITQSLEGQIDDAIETKKGDIIYNVEIFYPKPLECKSIFIDTLNSEVYKLKKPIPVYIEYDGKTYTANNYDLGLYGYDDIELEAIEDLKKSIIECYEDLKSETELGPVPKRMMVYYKEIIEEE